MTPTSLPEGERKAIGWKAAGILLGLVGTVAVAVQGPIGVSTAYVTTEAAAVAAVSGDEVARANAYWKKIGTSLTPEWVFVVSIVAGALGAAALSGTRRRESVPRVWRERFGPREGVRFAAAFAGGFLLLFGARLAGGCTSGHVLSGMSQLAVSGMVFAAATFAAAIPFARALYGRAS
jgi:uncharacterized membrane protein YedE/YeeE